MDGLKSKEPKTISVFNSSISSQAPNMTFPNVTLLLESYCRHIKLAGLSHRFEVDGFNRSVND